MSPAIDVDAIVALAERRGFLGAVAEFVRRFGADPAAAEVLAERRIAARDVISARLDHRDEAELLKVAASAEIVPIGEAER